MGIMTFDIASEQTLCRGETVCGDAVHVFKDEATSQTLIAVVDGLGHGPQANEASTAYIDFVRSVNYTDISLPELMKRASKAIARTRGAAASLVLLDGAKSTLQYVGVGNVEVIAASVVPIRPISRPGIVGRRIGKIIKFEYQLHFDDLITIFTDGISSRFKLDQYRQLDPQAICREIIRDWGKNHDDATIAAVRCK